MPSSILMTERVEPLSLAEPKLRPRPQGDLTVHWIGRTPAASLGEVSSMAEVAIMAEVVIRELRCTGDTRKLENPTGFDRCLEGRFGRAFFCIQEVSRSCFYPFDASIRKGKSNSPLRCKGL